MAHLTSSRGPHVRDLFVGTIGEDMMAYEQKESKKKFSMASSKNKRAPPPPKLGQYKPKILQADSFPDVPVPAVTEPTPQRPPRKENRAKAIIMGDKDVPMTLAPLEAPSDGEEDTPSSPSRHTRSSLQNGLGPSPHSPAPPHPQSPPHYAALRSTDPLEGYGPGHPPPFSPGGAGEGLREPHSPTSPDRPVAPPRYKKRTTASRRVLSPRRTEEEEIEGVVVPAPDYDEDERTIAFDPEDSMNDDEKPAYRDFMGEDFAKYLPDDSPTAELDTRSLRPRPPPSRKSLDLEKRAQTEARRPKFKKRGVSDKKMKKKGSLRHFSFADSKLASLDEGGEKQRPKSVDMTYSEMVDDAEVFMENKTESYETYLNSRHGNLESPRSGSFGDGDVPASHGLPVQHAAKKDNVWKKLTWKIKRRVSGYSLPS